MQRQQILPAMGMFTLQGAFWGMLFELVCFAPLLSLPASSTRGHIRNNLYHGINDTFNGPVRKEMCEGTSVIILMTGSFSSNKVVEALKQLPMFRLSLSNI